MPEYTYICPGKHTQTLTVPMLFGEPVICAACGLPMHRKPQLVGVTWGGLRPSQGEYSDTFKRMFNSVDERRDKLAEKHAAHERRTKESG